MKPYFVVMVLLVGLSACGESIPHYVKDLKADRVWGLTSNRSPVVAVIDSGTVVDHPEFIRKDGSSVILDSYDLTLSDPLLRQTSGLGVATNPHGLVVQSIIAAPENDWGDVGIAPNASIVSMKVLEDGQSFFSPETVMDALDLAIDLHVDVINLSFCASAVGNKFRNKLIAAHDAGIIVVSISGNDDQGGVPCYPAAEYPYVFSATALNWWGKIADFSTPGLAQTYALPGTRMCAASLDDDETSCDNDGTSFAGAALSGVAALAKSRFPGLLPDCFRQGLDASGSVLNTLSANAQTRSINVPDLFAAIEQSGCAQ